MCPDAKLHDSPACPEEGDVPTCPSLPTLPRLQKLVNDVPRRGILAPLEG
jgi:hypothetical protein